MENKKNQDDYNNIKKEKHITINDYHQEEQCEIIARIINYGNNIKISNYVITK